MTREEFREQIRSRLPVNDPKYIAFKKMKGMLGNIDSAQVREERVDAIISRYQRCS